MHREVPHHQVQHNCDFRGSVYFSHFLRQDVITRSPSCAYQSPELAESEMPLSV